MNSRIFSYNAKEIHMDYLGNSYEVDMKFI